MSFGPPTNTTNSALSVIAGLLIPMTVIVGLFVMMALHDINDEAALAIITAVAGVHGGATIANNSNK